MHARDLLFNVAIKFSGPRSRVSTFNDFLLIDTLNRKFQALGV